MNQLLKYFTYLAHGFKKLLHKRNILCKQLWHAAAEDTKNWIF